MTEYRVTINREKCIDCGIANGRCPTFAIQMSRMLRREKRARSMGVFSESSYDYVKKLVKGCPAKAMTIEKIEE